MNAFSTLQDLFDNSVKLRFYLDDIDSSTDRQKLKDNIRKIMESIRKISVATVLEGKQIICITGLQGVGKSSLIKTMYNLPDGLLNIGNAIGEKVPVLISEKNNISEPKVCKVILEKNSALQKYEKKEIEITNEEFANESANKNTSNVVLYMQLYVPKKIIRNENTHFMLLPGFEREKDYWHDLLTLSVSCSDSCIFALTGDKLASEKNDEILNFVSDKIGFDKMVFAITHSESYDEKTKADLRNRIKGKCHSPNLEDDKIIFTTTNNCDWLDELKNTVEKYANDSNTAEMKLSDELKEEIETLKDIREEIKSIVDDHLSDNKISVDSNVQDYLDFYRESTNDWREIFQKKLDECLNKAKTKSIEKLKNNLKNNQKEYYINNAIKRFFGDGIENLNKANRLIEDSLKDDDNSTPLYTIAFAKAIGELIKEVVTNENLESFVPEAKKDNPFLPDTKTEKEKKKLSIFKKDKNETTDIVTKEDAEIKTKAIAIRSDVNTLVYGPNKTGQKELHYRNPRQTVELMIQSQVFEYGRSFLDAIDKEKGSAFLEKINLRSTLLIMNEFEKTLDTAKTATNNIITTFNDMYSMIAGQTTNNKNEKKTLSDTAKKSMGILATAAVDYVPDAKINLFGLAEMLGLSEGAVAGIAGGIIAAVLAVAEVRTARKDLVNFQNDEIKCIEGVYETLKSKCLESFDEIIVKKNSKRLEATLNEIFGANENYVAYFNTQSVLQTIKNNLRDLQMERGNDDFKKNFAR